MNSLIKNVNITRKRIACEIRLVKNAAPSINVNVMRIDLANAAIRTVPLFFNISPVFL